MAKKKRKEKEIARLRQEVEVLRAQLADKGGSPKEPPKEEKVVKEQKEANEVAKPKAQVE
ncbi:hypothetical protein GTO10_00990, partial [Candidatus Saccharibacteria bacterium]|nr:hypothetical protein [Candidatus Saccharibacteria bacterium]